MSYKTITPRKHTGQNQEILSSKWGCVEFDVAVASSNGRDSSLSKCKGLVGSEAPTGYHGGEEIMFVPCLRWNSNHVADCDVGCYVI